MSKLTPIPAGLLRAATDALLADKVRVFQGARIAHVMNPSEEDHVSELYRYFLPPMGAKIVDLGCGIGEVARLMGLIDPTLQFTLVNNNEYQLDLCPPGAARILCDFHDIPVSGNCFDAGMFCYSLCHSDFAGALREAARVIRRGGSLLIYDYERVKGDNNLFKRHLYSQAITKNEMYEISAQAGWKIDKWRNPPVDDSPFRHAFGNDIAYAEIFNDLKVCMWKAYRQ